MTIRICWHKDLESVLLWEFSGEWTYEEFHAATLDSTRLVSEFDKAFDLIVNMNHTTPPRNILHRLHDAMQNASHQQRNMVFVDVSFFTKALINILKLAGTAHTDDSQLFFCDTMEQAVQLLHRLRQDHPINR